MSKFILVDIDHTISDATWRDGMINGSDWDSYHMQSVHDKPIQDIIDMMNACHSCGFELVGLTTRPEKWRGITNKWLVDNGVNIDILLMRPNDDYSKTPELKMSLAIKEFGETLDNVVAIFDDREDVVAQFKARGIHAFQVHARGGGGNHDSN